MEKKDEKPFSIYEYNGQQQENLLNVLTISKGINGDILISNENNSYKMNISSINPKLDNFISCDDDDKSISINLKNSNKNNYLKALEIFGNVDINHQAYNEIKKEDDMYLINDDKKNKFIIFKLFNPKGKSKDLKDIRNYINKVIFEKNKKKDKNIFNITKKKGEKDQKRKRKHKPDEIRKKIKARFLKSLKNRINEELKYANSKKYFDFLPQCFICEITKKKNKEILNMTLREIMTTNFFAKYNKKTKIKEDNSQISNNNMLKRKRNYDCPPPDIVKYNNNIEVIKYLENNEVIKNQINFDIIGNKTFTELFNEYLESNEFEKDIFGLKYEKKEDYFYIKEYIIKAFDFIKDFSN